MENNNTLSKIGSAVKETGKTLYGFTGRGRLSNKIEESQNYLTTYFKEKGIDEESSIAKGIRASAISDNGKIDPTKLKAFEDVYKKPIDAVELAEKKGYATAKGKNKATSEIENKKFTQDVELIGSDVGELLGVYDSIPENLVGPVAGRTAGAWESIAQNVPEVADYLESKQFFLSSIARTLGAERGVLTDTDIRRVDGLFPRLSNTKEVGIRKMKRIKEFIAKRIEQRGTPEMLNKFNETFLPALESKVTGDSSSSDVVGIDVKELSNEEILAALGGVK